VLRSLSYSLGYDGGQPLGRTDKSDLPRREWKKLGFYGYPSGEEDCWESVLNLWRGQ